MYGHREKILCSYDITRPPFFNVLVLKGGLQILGHKS